MDDKILEVVNEIRSFKDNLKAEQEKLAEERRAFEQERAAKDANNPAHDDANQVSSWRDMVKAMSEKRSITLNGTGAINQINGLWDLIKQREPLLDRVSYFRGPNSQTQVAILSARPAIPSKVAEGATNITPDSTAGIGSKSLYPYTWAAVLPVTYEAVLYSISDIEQRIPALMAESFRTAMCNGMFVGDGSNSTIKGIFASGSVAADNLIETASASAVSIKDLEDLALKVKDYDVAEPVIIMEPAIYSAIAAADANGYDFLKEELVRNKSIEGIPVVLTGKAPSFAGASGGDIVVWCGDLKNYALAIADEVTIEPLKKVGDTNTYYQAVMAFTGDVVEPRNVFGLKKKS